MKKENEGGHNSRLIYRDIKYGRVSKCAIMQLKIGFSLFIRFLGTTAFSHITTEALCGKRIIGRVKSPRQ